MGGGVINRLKIQARHRPVKIKSHNMESKYCMSIIHWNKNSTQVRNKPNPIRFNHKGTNFLFKKKKKKKIKLFKNH